MSIDSVSVFLKVDHSDSVHAPVLYWVFILFDKVLKSSLRLFSVSASKLVDLSALFILVLDFDVDIGDNNVVVGYPWYRYRVCYYCWICSED